MDGGSGYDLGSRALGAVSKALDGRGAKTCLVDSLQRRLRWTPNTPPELQDEVVKWGQKTANWESVVELAHAVVECAGQGDPVAETILRHGVGELYRSIKTVVDRLDLARVPGGFKLVLAGDLLQEGGLYTQYLTEWVKENLPTAEVCFPVVEPAESAAMLALRSLQPVYMEAAKRAGRGAHSDGAAYAQGS